MQELATDGFMLFVRTLNCTMIPAFSAIKAFVDQYKVPYIRANSDNCSQKNKCSRSFCRTRKRTDTFKQAYPKKQGGYGKTKIANGMAGPAQSVWI